MNETQVKIYNDIVGIIEQDNNLAQILAEDRGARYMYATGYLEYFLRKGDIDYKEAYEIIQEIMMIHY